MICHLEHFQKIDFLSSKISNNLKQNLICLTPDLQRVSRIYSLEAVSLLLDVPEILHDCVHGPAVVKLLLKSHTLTCHLDPNKHVQK